MFDEFAPNLSCLAPNVLDLWSSKKIAKKVRCAHHMVFLLCSSSASFMDLGFRCRKLILLSQITWQTPETKPSFHIFSLRLSLCVAMPSWTSRVFVWRSWNPLLCFAWSLIVTAQALFFCSSFSQRTAMWRKFLSKLFYALFCPKVQFKPTVSPC